MKESILFIGDSITDGFDTAKLLSEFNISNRGISGLGAQDMFDFINEKWFTDRPDLVFICIGTNDLARGIKDETILLIIEIICKQCIEYSKSSKIILTAIFPTRNNESRPNKRIVSFNEQLKILAEKIGCSFFDLHKYFLDDAGMLKSEYTEDGLHLTRPAYLKWADEFRIYISGNWKV